MVIQSYHTTHCTIPWVFSCFRLFSHCLSLSLHTHHILANPNLQMFSYCMIKMLLRIQDWGIKKKKNIKLPMQISLKVPQSSICLCYSMEHSCTLRKCYCFITVRHKNPEMCSRLVNVFSGKSLTFKQRYKCLFFCTPNWMTVFDILLNWKLLLCHVQLYSDWSFFPPIHPTPILLIPLFLRATCF